MKRLILIVPLLLAACAGGPNKLVRRAVDATGGHEALARVEGYHIESTGEWMGQPYKAVAHMRFPGSWRWDMDSGEMTMSMWVLGPDQDAYSSMGGKAMAVSGDRRAETIQHMRVGNAMLLPHLLLEPGVELKKAGSVEIDGKRCRAIEVRFDGSEPATFVFDPDTDRVRRVMFQMTDAAAGGKVPATLDVGDWQDVDGVWVPFQTHMTWGEGEKAGKLEEEVTVVEWNPEITEGILDAPETVPPPEATVRKEEATLIAAHTYVGPYDQVGPPIEKVVKWIAENGGTPNGPVALVYPEDQDYANPKTKIQIPMQMEKKPEAGEVRRLYRKAFLFARAPYEGPAAGCWALFEPVMEWCKENGWEKIGPMRVHYLSAPDEQGMCTAEVGCAVKRK